MIKRPVGVRKAPEPIMWSVEHFGYFPPEYGREVAVFWDQAAAYACSEERNKFNYCTDVQVYAYADE